MRNNNHSLMVLHMLWLKMSLDCTQTVQPSSAINPWKVINQDLQHTNSISSLHTIYN